VSRSASPRPVLGGERPLVGRDRELESIEAVLAAARRGEPAALLLHGEPGVGKTALLRAATARAGDMLVLGATGIEAESELAFAGLTELLGPIVDHRAALPRAQAAALEGALGLSDAAVGDPLTVFAAALALVGVAAAQGPVLMVVDDAQWLDGSTLDALRFVAKRLGACPAALLLATREELDPDGWPRAEIAVVRGLERDSALELLGGEGMAPGVRERLVAATAGNPLALWEMPAQLTDAQRSGREPLADPLPAGASLERVYRGRVGALEPDTREALLMVAATHADALTPVAAALRARGIDVDTLAAAEAAGLVERRDDRVVFSHPLVRSAVYWGAPLPARRAAHAALAEHADAESRAWHLAAAATAADESVAGALEDAARAAERRGALAAATEAFERAGRLSPAGARVRRRSEAARTAVLAGRLDVARHTLDDLLTEPHDAGVHADLELMRATVMLLGGEPLAAYELLVGEAGRIEPHDPPRAAALLSAAGIALLIGGHVRDLRAVAERARELAGPGADLVPTVLLAEARAAAGEVEQARELLLGREEELLAFGANPGPVQELVVIAAFVLVLLEEWPRAERMLDGLIAGARQAGAVRALAFPLAVSAGLDVRRGHWGRARRKGREALPIAEETSPGFALTYAVATLAYLDAAQGRERSCREQAARLERVGAEFELAAAWAFSATTTGLLELGLGRIDAAVAQLEQAVAHLAGWGVEHPAFLPAEAYLIEALVRARRLPEARARQAALEARAEPDGGWWPRGTVAHGRGLLADEAFDAHFAQARECYAALPSAFDVARTELAWGERLRRERRRTEARAQLTAALAGFDRLGARPWAARVRAELAAAEGGRARPAASHEEPLTHKEAEVADLVASGATNREAAAALFLSPRTVEHHLRQVYRKLGVRSRSELAAAYGAARPPADRNR
jgi:DNA-binding CsgD family transcriptional regulator